MKSDLDRLMAARGMDALVAVCEEAYSPPADYLTNGAKITHGMVIKKRGAEPIIYANPMEVEEAAKSGLKVVSFGEMGLYDLYAELNGDRETAQPILWERALKASGVEQGMIGLYGVIEFSYMLALLRKIEAQFPQYQFVGEMGLNGLSLFDEAFVTKDADEITRIRSVAARTSQVLQATWDFIASHHADGDRVINDEGTPLTIGAVKRFVRRTLLDYDLEDTNMIFAQGRDGGFPHSRGEEDMELRLGQAIIFDLFPHEIGGGYFHDCTRTWSIGYATPEVQQAYEEVMDAFDISVEVFRVGKPTKDMQTAVQDYFESKGHPTTRSHPNTTVGFMHSLGHGLGLNIHERPSISHISSDTFQKGNMITIEPGLYYPERGFGMRVEDTFYVNENGDLISLTDFPKTLVLPLSEQK
jgi:Xaa-Pro aminopeptidase